MAENCSILMKTSQYLPVCHRHNTPGCYRQHTCLNTVQQRNIDTVTRFYSLKPFICPEDKEKAVVGSFLGILDSPNKN